MSASTITGPRLLGHWPVGSPEWHAARAHGIGGSEVAPILGLSPFESRFALWHRKQALASPVIENEVMEWGKRLEDAVCAKFAENHPELYVDRSGTWVHGERTWQVGNPDRLLFTRDAEPITVDDDGIRTRPSALLEAKCAHDDLGWGKDGTDEIPVYYRAQALHYLDVFGLTECHIAVLIGGSDYREYLITYDADEQAWIREQVEAFLASITAGDRPDIDAHGQTYQVLRELHPDIADTEVEIAPALALAYRDALQAVKDADTAKTLQSSLVLDAIGGGRRAVCNGERIAMRVPNGDHPPYLKAQPQAKPTPTDVRKATR